MIANGDIRSSQSSSSMRLPGWLLCGLSTSTQGMRMLPKLRPVRPNSVIEELRRLPVPSFQAQSKPRACAAVTTFF